MPKPKWKPGDRVIVRLPDRSLPRGPWRSVRQVDVHGFVMHWILARVGPDA